MIIMAALLPSATGTGAIPLEGVDDVELKVLTDLSFKK